MAKEYIQVGENNDHIVDDDSCAECNALYPQVCGCGGLIHSDFDDRDHRVYLCDQCDSEEEGDEDG